MRPRFVSAAAAIFLVFPGLAAAHADTLNVAYQLNGAFAGSGSFTLLTSPDQTVYSAGNGLGTISGQLAGANFVGMDNTVSWADGQLVGMTGYAFEVGDGGGPDGFNLGILNFAGTSFEADYEAPNPPGSLSPANHYGSEVGTITAAAIPPGTTTAVTPEPSTLAMLGTGLLGATGVLRRRWRA